MKHKYFISYEYNIKDSKNIGKGHTITIFNGKPILLGDLIIAVRKALNSKEIEAKDIVILNFKKLKWGDLIGFN